jgi:superfamily II DNA or RNA helicase
MKVSITILDPILTRVDEGKELIDGCLSFTSVYYKQGPYRKERKSYVKKLIHKGVFWTGLVPRVQEYCKRENIALALTEKSFEKLWINLRPLFFPPPKMNGFDLRQDQLDLIRKAITQARGVIQAPTGSGKTALAAGLIKCYPKAKTLFLCHTKTLIDQTAKMFRDQGLLVSTVVEGKADLSGNVVVATHQSFKKVKVKGLDTLFQIVIVDEAHHVSSLKVTYAEILSKLLCPIRIGLTATVPTAEESVLAMESFLGPVIGKFSVEDGVDLGILAMPRIQLMRVPKSIDIVDLRKYSDIYDTCIVRNESRNRIITRTTRGLVNKEKSVLILVTKIEHGTLLMDSLAESGIASLFVRGSTEREMRVQIQEAFQQKRVNCVIATATWREGVNVPSLDCVINAAGGKSEIFTLQSIGRGLRTTNSKQEVLIVDFLDPYKYLSEHAIQRISIYVENGWI